MKKPKLSEIKARPACICNWNPPSEKDYLLKLVKRLGKALEWTLSNLKYLEEPSQRDDEGCITHMRCKVCKAETRWNYPDMPEIPHTSDCEHREARELLKEIKE